jgi:hypothetical protein
LSRLKMTATGSPIHPTLPGRIGDFSETGAPIPFQDPLEGDFLNLTLFHGYNHVHMACMQPFLRCGETAVQSFQ